MAIKDDATRYTKLAAKYTTIVLDDDTARARLTDALTSHLAANRTQDSLPIVRQRVLDLINLYGELTGSQVNSLYAAQGWRGHWDSPRKRAGELVTRGQVVKVNEDARRGTETIYRAVQK